MIRKVLSVLGGLLVLAAVLVVINSLHVGRYQVVVDHGENWVYKIDTRSGRAYTTPKDKAAAYILGQANVDTWGD